MKIERMLQSQGFGSRKECRALILAGALSINGQIVDDPSADYPADDLVFQVDGTDWRYREQAYLAMHKPAGFECSRKPTFHPSIYTLLPPQFANRNIQPVGRLDQDTTGLLLLSDDGQFIHRWSSGRKRIPKEYRVRTADPVSDELIARLVSGVQLIDEPQPIAALSCARLASNALSMTVTEGKYHQVKRMVVAAGGHVESLHRLSVGGLVLPPDIPEGGWRWLTANDLATLSDFQESD